MESLSADRASSRSVLNTGLCIGALLSIVMFASLVAANRCPSLEAYALERNAISYSLFVVLMLSPMCWFPAQPWRAFASSMIGWLIFTAAYDLAGFFFKNLFRAVLHTPFQLLIEGAVLCALLAAGAWVVEMVLYARHHPIKPRRKPPADPVHHQPTA